MRKPPFVYTRANCNMRRDSAAATRANCTKQTALFVVTRANCKMRMASFGCTRGNGSDQGLCYSLASGSSTDSPSICKTQGGACFPRTVIRPSASISMELPRNMARAPPSVLDREYQRRTITASESPSRSSRLRLISGDSLKRRGQSKLRRCQPSAQAQGQECEGESWCISMLGSDLSSKHPLHSIVGGFSIHQDCPIRCSLNCGQLGAGRRRRCLKC